MPRAALSPENGTYVMEVRYQTNQDDEEAVLVERVTSSLRVAKLIK